VKLQCLHKVLRTIGHSPRRSQVHNMHVDFQRPYVYDYITELCRQEAEVIKVKILVTLCKAKPGTGNTGGLNLAAVWHPSFQVTRLKL
jgi:hypothetical protein